MNTKKSNDFENRLDEALSQCDRTSPLPDAEFVSRLRLNVLRQTEAAPCVASSEALRRGCELITQSNKAASLSRQSPLPFDDSGCATQSRSGPPPARSTKLRVFARGLIAAGIAAAVLTTFWLRTPSSWAQVQEALNLKPWIHLRTKLDDGRVHENWISLSQQKSAFRVGPTAQYIDVRGDLQFDYEESRGTVIRAPHQPIQSPESMFVLFQQLLQGKQPNVEEIQHNKVLETRSRKVVEDGREWLDVEFTLQHIEADPAMRSTARLEFRLDPPTKLPQTMTVTVLDGGPNFPGDSQRRFVYDIDYPAEGPADIYALGIPRDAKLVDRVPSDDTNRALKAIAAGRREFDPYFAIVFHAAGSDDQPFSGLPSSVVWRRGNQVRVETCVPFEPYSPYSERPTGMSDLTWWKQQLKHFRFLPRVVCDGKTGYLADVGTPDEQGHQRVTSWKPLASIRKGEFLSDLHISPVSHFLPEFFAYPRVESSDTTAVHLEPEVRPDLPRGSLLTFSVTVPLPLAYHRTRFWLDDDRGYVATRMNLDQLELSDDEAKAGSYCVEDLYSMRNFERSPKGFWYPTLVVRESRVKDPKKTDGVPEQLQQISTAFLLDFKAEIPDSLFTTTERKTGKERKTDF